MSGRAKKDNGDYISPKNQNYEFGKEDFTYVTPPTPWITKSDIKKYKKKAKPRNGVR